MNEPTLSEVFPAWKEQTQQSKLILNNTTEQSTETGVLTEPTEFGVLTESTEPIELVSPSSQILAERLPYSVAGTPLLRQMHR